MVNIVQLKNEHGDVLPTNSAELKTQKGRDLVAQQLGHETYESLIAALQKQQTSGESAA